MPKPIKNPSISERMVSAYKPSRMEKGTPYPYKKEDLTAYVSESYGMCKNTQKKIRRGSRRTRVCNEYHTVLGNGYCMACWDGEVERLHNNAMHRSKNEPPIEQEISILPINK